MRFGYSKGEIKPLADCRVIDSPEKQTNKFDLFFLHITAKKNSFGSSFFEKI